MLDVNKLLINDDPLFDKKRTTKFLSGHAADGNTGTNHGFYNFENEILACMTIELDFNYEDHKRTVTPLISSFAAIGGLTEFVFTGFWFLYAFFGQPFRDL